MNIAIYSKDWVLQKHFSLQIKDDAKSYQMLPRCGTYVQQQPFKKEVKRRQEHHILTPLAVDKTSE